VENESPRKCSPLLDPSTLNSKKTALLLTPSFTGISPTEKPQKAVRQ